jgi:succinate dehydrogenase / fumarate reductase cytochrome b subunit
VTVTPPAPAPSAASKKPPARAPEKPLVKNPKAAALRSTVVMKYVMGASGLLLIAWLLAHMYGNLKAFWGRESFDDYAHHLRTLGTPLLWEGGFLLISRIVIGLAVIAHIYSAASLWKRDRDARGGTTRYRTTQNKRGVQRTYASFTMRWGGIVVIAFLFFHLLNLTANNSIHPGGASPDPYQRLLNTFDHWYMVVAYTVALLAVGFHVRHGVWSAFTTLGANRNPTRRAALNLLAYAVAITLTVGFLLVPWSIFFGWVD